MNAPATVTRPEPADFASDQTVRWCPGCGDYAILKGVQKTLADRAVPREQTVFVSGIGCSSRLPYYLSTYGFHTIHGRAPAVATGLKLANPSLDVWIVTGDGDGLSIGGNHLLHALRRDLDLQILLFNNEIYGLTKGQVSPTSVIGTRSPTSPEGSTDRPVSAARFALGAGGRFVARAVDVQQARLPEIMGRAADHRGTAFVEILQNCPVYNDGAFSAITDRKSGADWQLYLTHGEPMQFGKDGEYGIRLDPQTLRPEVVRLEADGVDVSDLLIHDETHPVLAGLLADMAPPAFPLPIGVLYAAPAEDEGETEGVVDATQSPRTLSDADFNDLLASEGTYRL